MKSVAIIGSAFAGNKGAAAMLESAVTHLTQRHPDISITHLSMYPRTDDELNPYANVHVMDASPLRLGVLINSGALAWRLAPFLRDTIRRAVPEVGAIADADVLLDQGGITFVDGREKYLIYNVASILPALNTKTPVVKCAQALGPFESPVNRWAATTFLPKMAAIVSRGAKTQEHLDGLGLANTTAGADLAFTLEVTAEDVESADAVAGTFFDGGDVVGVSPSQVLRAAAEARGEDYVGDVAAQIDFVTEELGRPVYLVAHSTRSRDDKLHNNDLPVCRAILARVRSPHRVFFPDGELSSQVLRSLIGRCDLFVASRFHAMVSSLAMGVPTLVLGWSHKYREVLDMFGLADWATSASDLDQTAFEQRVRDLDGQADGVREAIAAALPGVKAKALGQLDVIELAAASSRRSDYSHR
ncbi:polysaccharide pyruvyl transferase family protein [Demequina sp. B12]|uniref:polysaccharide pyruvyl transferase family protein n=1 Tax=Demequina sp. B12 TaxID=2992757 RepID=UPI00237A36DA|nr:polysaccharide pyruvyl transferase family protein [Demequina sp. B12]MDE0572072.1 polysaccharide pyruvyl transferase family protein [Demequina sp. B12]